MLKINWKKIVKYIAIIIAFIILLINISPEIIGMLLILIILRKTVFKWITKKYYGENK